MIKNAENEFKSLIFHYLLQKYYENKDKDKLKYLCKLYEFGTIDYPVDKKSYYAIMENCGMDLFTYFYDTKKNKSMCLKDRLIKLITIFKECCNAVKVIHDLEYLHLDIKLENFMISNEGQIKIIDFGFVKKNGYETIDRFGTKVYMANDWVINFSSGKKTTLQYHHDIFSLGCIFIELLYNYVFQKNILMTCPIYEKKISKKEISRNEIYSFREKYDSSIQDIKIKADLEELLLQKNRSSILTKYFKTKSTENFINDLCLLISFMVNSDPEERYEKIDGVIAHLNYLNL
jgi:serine/threonine protein kinase